MCGPHPKTKSIATTITHTISRPHNHDTEDKLISARTRSISIQRRKKKSDSNTKTKSNSIPHAIIKLISTLRLKPSQFDPHSKSSPFRCLHTTTDLSLIHTLKPGIFRLRRKNHFNSDPCTEVKLVSVPAIKSCHS